MTKSLSGMKIAILAANGYSEDHMTALRREMSESGAMTQIVSNDSGLISGWNGKGWGHNFPVDMALNTALAIDFDMLVIPGGERSLNKLKMTAHTNRFIGAFVDSLKPVAAMDDAVMLMSMTECMSGKTMSGPEDSQTMMADAGATWSEDAIVMDGMVMTGTADMDEYMPKMINFFASTIDMAEAA